MLFIRVGGSGGEGVGIETKQSVESEEKVDGRVGCGGV